MGIRANIKALLVCCLALGLAGCGSNEMSELKEYVAKVKKRQPKEIEPLPTFKPFEPYNYQVQLERSPFKTKVIVPIATASSPDMQRPREELENYPLDALNMVGVIMRGDKKWALVSSPDKKVHKVTVGMYMGKNYGQVTEIYSERLDLLETITDRFGVWQKREAEVRIKGK